MLSLIIPPHLNCVATLPYEMSSVLKATIENKNMSLMLILSFCSRHASLRQVLGEPRIQDMKYDFTADLTGIGDRSEYEICDM